MLNDDTFAQKIIERLGRQPEVPIRIDYQLRQARAQALMRVSAPSRVWTRPVQWLSLRAGAGIALAILAIGYTTLRFYSPTPDDDELDAQVITGDLPLAAYLDPGFARYVSAKGE